MLEQLNETIEDLQFRALRRTKIFDHLSLENFNLPKKWIAASSRYGICIFVGPQNKIYSCFCMDIHKLSQCSAGDNSDIRLRTLDYYNQNAQISSISVNSDGSVIAFSTNTPNGPFVDIFDVITFAPTAPRQQKLVPVASIRLSSENSAKFTEMQWNPIEPEVFAALASDNTLSTFKCSLQMGSSFSLLGSLNVGATCLCWSPKGKQLAIGNANGKVHQLKPDLSSVRVIDPPAQIPGFGSYSHFPCVALCWLSTTEWLVSHMLDNSVDLPPNISLLVVKKQQPPKWTHFGDVFSLSRKSPTFYSMLEWQMVFVFSDDSPSVVVFGLRGEKWLKFEFETFDIEMPLTADNKETFPLGMTLDFSSTKPFPIGEGSDRSVCPPPPFVHFLNSSGLLLPYAIVSLNNERPLLTKAPEHIEMNNAQFEESPTNGGENSADKTPIVSKKQQKEEKKSTNSEYNDKAVILAEGKTMGKENGERNRKEMAIKSERGKVAALEEALEKSVTEYTAKRNEQMERIAQLGQLRREVEKSASSLDTESLVELHNIKKELFQSFRQSFCSLNRLFTDTNDKIEFLNGVKMSYAAFRGGLRPELNKPSFDMERRLYLTEKSYENIMDKMKRMREIIGKLEGCRKSRISRIADDTIGPIEQRKIIQINENIAKMSAKLSSRLNQIRRSVGQKHTVAGTASDAKKSTQISLPLVDFCALELEQLKLPSVERDCQRLITCDSTIDSHQFQNNLRNYLTNKPKEVEVKPIFPLKMPDVSKIAQKLSYQSVADRKLSQRIAEAASSPPKPQLVSVGVQSTDFVAQSQEKTPKRVPLKKTATTPVTTKTPMNGGRQSLRNVVPIPSTPFSSISSKRVTETVSKETPMMAKQMDKITMHDKVTVPLVTTPPAEMPLPKSVETILQTHVNGKELTKEEEKEKQIQKEIQSAKVTTEKVAEEGMEDEAVDTTNGEMATFDFIKSGLGSSTPIDASRNPFGSMVPSQGSSNISGPSLFGTAQNSFSTPSGASSFGTPASKPTFGSLGVSPSVGVSPFGSSPFSSQSVSKSSFGGGLGGAITAPSAFGGGASFGSVSPFAAAKPSSGGFGASAFGGGSTSSGGKSLFGGGIGTGGNVSALNSGFSAFANKSAGFGQLAGQQQQSPPSLFGGGPQTTDASFNQPKTSAFTTFRK